MIRPTEAERWEQLTGFIFFKLQDAKRKINNDNPYSSIEYHLLEKILDKMCEIERNNLIK
jgi:hypothetical protein